MTKRYTGCYLSQQFQNGYYLLLWIIFIFFYTTFLWASDRVTIVQYPLINRPILVLPGESFTIECNVTKSTKDWQVALNIPQLEKELTLAVTSGEYSNGVRKLTATIPLNSWYELYDLRIQASGGKNDVVRNCVRVIPTYKNNFTFAHLPDCHLPAVSWIGFYDDLNTVPEFKQIMKELNLINPEFVLQTGDLVDNGQDEDQYRLVQELLEEFEIPIFVTGGNHDLWYDGHNYWYKYFGKKMDYSFQYSTMRFIGLEMYDIPTKTYTPEQMNWLRTELDASIDVGEESRIIFTHYDESRQLTGDFVDQYLIDGIFYGHTHINSEQFLGLRQAPKVNTSYTMNDNGEYRLIKVKNGVVEEYPVMKFRHLWANISPENDGASWRMKAEIHNNNDVDLEDILVKLHVNSYAAPFNIIGGNVLQFIDYGTNKRVYYVTTNVPANDSATVSVDGNFIGSEPPIIKTYSPLYDTTIFGGQILNFEIQTTDKENPSSLNYTWKKDGEPVLNETSHMFSYNPMVDFEGETQIEVEVSDGWYKDTHLWTVYIKKSSGKPELISSTRTFFSYDEEVVIEWTEPNPGTGVFEYGLSSGKYTGSITEVGSSNQVIFIPKDRGMGIGVYFCRITSSGLSSDEFPIVVESSQAPEMKGPVGSIKDLSPVFKWVQVQEQGQGVPYYLLILTDQEIVITEDEETGEYSVEGANPIWAVLVPAALTKDGVLAIENSVPYGLLDPSGIFTSFPAPLLPGGEYWWVVLNCYGNAPELVSTVQSGVSQFRIDLPLPDLEAPELLLPDNGAFIYGNTIIFRWRSVTNAVGYNFYPFKVEIEEGVEVVRPIWETVFTTTNTILEYDAASLLVKGNYKWKVAAIADNGAEVPSDVRWFNYDAPSATLNIRTHNNRGTQDVSDDLSLPRVTINYDALEGVDMGLPLSTDGEGERTNIIISPGTYVFTANKDGFAPFKDTLSLEEDQIITEHFRLTPDPSTLTGTVYDQDGNPVVSANILVQHSLYSNILRKTTSSQNGNFSVSLLPGPWIVSGSKQGYQESSPISVSIRTGEIKALDSSLLLLRNENQVSGVVVNITGQAVYGAAVKISGNIGDYQEIATDSEGNFSFSVYDGNWMISVNKSGFTSPPARWISVSGGQSLEVTPDLVLTPSGSLVSGKVSDGFCAIEGAVTKAVPASGSVVTGISDRYGQFTFTLSKGYYSLYAEKKGFSSGEPVEVSLEPGETVSGITLPVEVNSGAISGSITIDGVIPLPDARININGESVLSDAGGQYRVEVSPSNYRISASKEGYLSSEPLDVTVAPGQNLEKVDFILTPNASVIKGRVVSSGGVAGATVRADDGLITETFTDDNGYYTLNVEAGIYKISAIKSGFISDTLEVKVGQAQVLEGIEILLKRNTAIIKGKIEDKSTGESLTGVKVEIKTKGVSTTSKQDGSYRFEVEPSELGYNVSASKVGFETKVQSTGSVVAGSTITRDFSLKIYSTNLSGIVTDEWGKYIGFASVMAISNSDTFSTLSELDGSYFLGLPSEGGTFAVSVMKKGYRFIEGTVNISLNSGEKKSYNFTLPTNFARLKGRIFNLKDSSFIASSSLQLSDISGLVSSTSSDESGQYDFINASGNPFLGEGIYNLKISKKGISDTLITDLSLTGGETKILDIGLRKYTGYLRGIVSDGLNPLPGVSIIVDHQDSEQRFSKISDNEGIFQINSIPAGDYRLKISLSGYTWYNSSGDTLVSAPLSNLLFILSENIGRFDGTITDLETGAGIKSAIVVVKDGYGNEAKTYSDTDGSYSITLLPTYYPYNIYVSYNGYNSVLRKNVSAIKDDTTNFRLQRIYGSISGVVTFKDNLNNTPVADVLVQVQNSNVFYNDTTDNEGFYYISNLFTSRYYVSVEKSGYVSVPSSRTIDLYNGGDITGIDFQIEEVSIADITIDGTSPVTSGGEGYYSCSAKAGDGRQVAIQPVWSVNLTDAVDSLSSEGILYVKEDYIGPLWIIITDSYSGIKDSVQIEVVGSVKPGDDEKVFRDYRGGVFRLPGNCVGSPLSFGIRFPKIPNIKRLMRSFKIIGDVYALQPPYSSSLKDSIFITLPVPETETSNYKLGKWNRNRLTWEIIEGTQTSSGLQIKTNQLAQWAVLAPSQPLGIRNFEAKPNPFSPLMSLLKISFVPTSRVSPTIFITVKIYNMAGDLVRELAVDRSTSKEIRTELMWDGRTDYGSMALNGRYLIYIEARDGSGVEKLLKSVVLVK